MKNDHIKENILILYY